MSSLIRCQCGKQLRPPAAPAGPFRCPACGTVQPMAAPAPPATRFLCPCGRQLQVPAQWAGRVCACPTCNRQLRVPEVKPPAPAGVASPAAGGFLRAGPPAPVRPAAGIRSVPGKPARLGPARLVRQRHFWPAAAGSAVVAVMMVAAGILLSGGQPTAETAPPKGAGVAEAVPPAAGAAKPPAPGPAAPPKAADPADDDPAEDGDPGPIAAPPGAPPDWFPVGPEGDRPRRQRLAWLRGIYRDAYEHKGRKSPRWDDRAHKALGAAESLPDHSQTWVDADGALRRLARAAVAAGCDDPLLEYLTVYHASAAGELTPGERKRQALAAADALRASAYPAVVRGAGLLNAAGALAVANRRTLEENGRLRRLLEDFAALVPEISVDKSPPAQAEAALLCEIALECWPAVSPDRQAGYDRLAAALDKAAAPEALRLTVKGRFLIDYAWDARGDGVADTVTQRGWQLFHGRLREARAALERAWELQPDCAAAPTHMITLAMGLELPADVRDTWFRRALRADPDNYRACAAKLLCLAPQWGGQEDDLLAFGRECAQTGNWAARLPFLLPEAHRSAARRWTDPTAHFKKDGVWGDIQSVYGPYLAKHPRARDDATWYCWYATVCDEHGEAHRWFERLGDRPSPGVFASAAEYRRLRAEAARLAAPLAARPEPKREEVWPAPQPRTPDGLTVTQLAQDPWKYRGKDLEVPALLARAAVRRGDLFELQVSDANRQRQPRLVFRAAAPLVAEWCEDPSGPFERPVWLRCRVEGADGDRAVVQVTGIVVLDRAGKVARTLPAPVAPGAPLTLDLINRDPGKYTGQTVIIKVKLAGTIIMRGPLCELQVFNLAGTRPDNLEFSTSRVIADQWFQVAGQGQERTVNVTCVIGAAVGRGRRPAVVSRIDVLNAQCGVVQSIP
jgi:hypothetical protein